MQKGIWQEVSFNNYIFISDIDETITMRFDFLSKEWAVGTIGKITIHFPIILNSFENIELRFEDNKPAGIFLYAYSLSEGKVNIENVIYDFKRLNSYSHVCFDMENNEVMQFDTSSGFNYDIQFQNNNKKLYPILLCINLFYIMIFRKRTLFL
jgi:hypothetical protein